MNCHDFLHAGELLWWYSIDNAEAAVVVFWPPFGKLYCTLKVSVRFIPCRWCWQSQQMLRNEAHNSTSHMHREQERMHSNEMRSSNTHHDLDGNLLVTIPKTKTILGIAIEGGANTKQPLPRIINIHVTTFKFIALHVLIYGYLFCQQKNGAAHDAGGLQVGQLILEVDNHKVEGMQHQNIAKLIAESYTKSDRQFISFLVTEPKKSNLEPKPTALIYLETVIVIIHFCLNIIFFLL